MSRSPSNISVLSEDERYVPWQYKWKRPRIARSKCSDKSISVNDLCQRVPIRMESARLNMEEIKFIQQNIICSTYKNAGIKECLGLEHSTKSSEDNFGSNVVQSDDLSYFVLVTTFASRSVVNFLQKTSTEKDDIIIPADTLLLEVVQDSQHAVESEASGNELNFDQMDVVACKLLYWPTSINRFSTFEASESPIDKIYDAGDLWAS